MTLWLIMVTPAQERGWNPMTEAEKALAARLAEALKLLDPSKLEYFRGYINGVADAAGTDKT